MAIHPANSRFVYISSAVACFLILILLGYHRDAVTQAVAHPLTPTTPTTPDTPTTSTTEHPVWPGQADDHRPEDDYFVATGERVAYATWYSSSMADGDDYSNDVYFIATRMLAYQFLHDPQTRTRRNIPFVVLVTPDVSQSRRDRLAKDGAIIRPIEWLTTDNEWYSPGRDNWNGIMSKLFIYDMTEYNRVLLVDGDTVLNRPLDGIWDDPGTKVVTTNPDPALKPEDEGELPSQYLLASTGEVQSANHSFPPLDEDWIDVNGFCAGYFMMHPDPKMLAYLRSVMVIRDRFRPDLMEQALLNYIHRRDGPMPWTDTQRHWNIREVTQNDRDSGLVSAHWKFWEWPSSGEVSIRDWMYEVRWRMQGYYQAYDEYKTSFPPYSAAQHPAQSTAAPSAAPASGP